MDPQDTLFLPCVPHPRWYQRPTALTQMQQSQTEDALKTSSKIGMKIIKLWSFLLHPNSRCWPAAEDRGLANSRLYAAHLQLEQTAKPSFLGREHWASGLCSSPSAGCSPSAKEITALWVHCYFILNWFKKTINSNSTIHTVLTNCWVKSKSDPI